jgi:hypothetical protein
LVRARALSAVLCLALVPVLSSHSRPAFGAATNQAPAAPLDSFIGEYTNPNDPDTPLSFYVREGKLVAESDRLVPTELTPISATEFEPDGSERDISLYSRCRRSRGERAGFRRIRHVSAHRRARAIMFFTITSGLKHDSHARRRQAARGDSEACDIAGPLPILMQRTPYGVDWNQPRVVLCGAARAGARRLHLRGEDIRGRYKSEGQFVMSGRLPIIMTRKLIDESTDTYDTVAMADQECAGNNGRVGVCWHQLSRLPGHDGGHRSAPGGEGDFAAGAHDRRVDRRRFFSQRRLPPELRLRLRAWHGIDQGATPTWTTEKTRTASPATGSTTFWSAETLRRT